MLKVAIGQLSRTSSSFLSHYKRVVPDEVEDEMVTSASNIFLIVFRFPHSIRLIDDSGVARFPTSKCLCTVGSRRGCRGLTAGGGGPWGGGELVSNASKRCCIEATKVRKLFWPKKVFHKSCGCMNMGQVNSLDCLLHSLVPYLDPQPHLENESILY